MGNQDDVDTVFAFEATTGRPRWKHSYSEPVNPKMYEGGPNATPTFHGRCVFVASRSGKVFSFNAADGRVVWSNSLAQVVGLTNQSWGISGSPAVVGSNILVNAGSAVVALDAASGQVQWTSAKETKGEYSFTTPMLTRVGERQLLLAHMQKSLFALSPENGRVLWQHAFGTGYETHSSDPVFTPAGIFLSSGDDGGELISFDSSEARRIWKNKNLATFTGTAVLLGNHLYGVDAAGYAKGKQELRCVEVATGSIKWALPGFGQDSWIASGHRLIVLSDRGELIVVHANPERGQVLARSQVLGGKCWTQPTLANGLLYCRNAKGQAVCLDLRPETRTPQRL
jgi:outer membrane protein assembly factor BamB